MLKKFWSLISLFLIFIIFLRVPQENVGLSSFANKSDLMGSPSSAQRVLNYITGICVIIYFLIALKLNIS